MVGVGSDPTAVTSSDWSLRNTDGQAGVQGMTRLGAASGPLLIADISGYTGFLATVADVHRDDAFADGRIPDAYSLVSSLLDGIITSIVPPYALAKLEGDAVFAFAPSAEGFPHGEAVLDCLATYLQRSRSAWAAPSPSGPVVATHAPWWKGWTSSSSSMPVRSWSSRWGAGTSWSGQRW